MTASPTPVTQVLLDASAVTYVDTSACDALRTLVGELRRHGVAVAFAHVRDPVRDRLRLGGVEAMVGAANFHERVTDGLRAFEATEARPAQARGARPR